MVIDVCQVILQFVLWSCMVFSIDLSQAGESRLDLQSFGIAGNRAQEFTDEFWPFGTRTDETHSAIEHVKELRNLIDATITQKPSDPGHALILRASQHRTSFLLGSIHHGTELIQGKLVSSLSDTLLTVQHWTERSQLDQDCR